MKIRTITIFLSITSEDMLQDGKSFRKKMEVAKKVACQIEASLSQESYEVQTIRVSTNAFEDYLNIENEGILDDQLELISEVVVECGISFFNLGPSISPASQEVILRLLTKSDSFNCSMHIPSSDHGVCDLDVCRKASEIMKGLEEETEGGLGNFRFVIFLYFFLQFGMLKKNTMIT